MLASSDTVSLSPPPKHGKLKVSDFDCLGNSSAAGVLLRSAADRALLPFCMMPRCKASPVSLVESAACLEQESRVPENLG